MMTEDENKTTRAMQVEDYDYYLPQELIAQTPIEPRDHSRLLLVDRTKTTVEHKHFYDLVSYLQPGDLLIMNDTKVIPARLIGHKETGAKVEVFLLHRHSQDTWEALVRPGKKLLPGATVSFGDKLQAEILDKTDFGGRMVRFIFDGVFEEILDELGQTPLPPYIHEQLQDKSRYQTVYAKVDGSAAAPTAGLHFTPELMQLIRDKGVDIGFVTLHVGLGTFRPVSAKDIRDHVMHSEYYVVSDETVQKVAQARQRGGRVIAIGTTAVRTLESAAEHGGMIRAGAGVTNIFIYPGYTFQVVNALVTNFHLPQSTLMMLVSALAGRERMLDVYHQAVEEKYRFFSFGDAMFIY